MKNAESAAKATPRPTPCRPDLPVCCHSDGNVLEPEVAWEHIHAFLHAVEEFTSASTGQASIPLATAVE